MKYIKEIILLAVVLVLAGAFVFQGDDGKMSPKGLVTQEGQIGDILVTTSVAPKMSPKTTKKSELSPSPTPSSESGTKNQSETQKQGTASPTPTQSPLPTQTARPTVTPTASPSPAQSPTPTPTPAPSPTATPSGPVVVVINEIGWMGTSASQYAEWIELYNPGDSAVDVTGWQIDENDGTATTAALTGSIPAHGYYLLERTTPSSPDAISDITGDYSGSFGGSGLKDGGEKLVLKDASGAVKDVVDCSSGWLAGTKNPHFSMERIAPDQGWATNNGQIKNGLDAGGSPVNGTPKARNSVSP